MTTYHVKRFSDKHAGKGRMGGIGSLATLTSAHQLTIPQALCVQLGLKQGDKVVFSVQEDGSVEIRPVRAALEALAASLGARPQKEARRG